MPTQFNATAVSLTPTPKASPTPLPGLADFLQPLMPIFARPSSQESFECYCTGLLTDLPRKTCDGIASAVAGTTTQRLQYLVTDADWAAVALDQQRVRQMVKASPAGGMLAIDDTTFPKKGNCSVGIAQLFFDQIRASAEDDERIIEAAKANTLPDFAAYLERVIDELFIDRMEGNEDIFARVMTDDAFRAIAQRHIAEEIFEHARDDRE